MRTISYERAELEFEIDAPTRRKPAHEIRRCGHAECRRTVRLDSTDPNCSVHRFVPGKTCLIDGCAAPLTAAHKRGMCSRCLQMKLEPGDSLALIRYCQGGCNRRIPKNNDQDVCLRCQSRNRQLDRAVKLAEIEFHKKHPQRVDWSLERMVRMAEGIA